ncbi:MAG: TonB-dependent receptor [Chlamydiota bacterium]|nr:TonB-dependent receptor [Chlamydiota bacterium]
MKRLLFGVFFGLFLVCNIAFASDAEDIQQLEPVFVTATNTDMSLRFISQSYTLLSHDTISSSNESSIVESLRTVPGLQLVQGGTAGSVSTAFIRGASPSQVLVMIDGIEINSALTGSADLSHILTDQVDRVEVMRGAHSALFGSEAMGGVINIITKKGAPTTQWTLLGEGGSEETYRVKADLIGTRSSLQYGIGASLLGTNGSYEHDDYRNLSLMGNTSTDITDLLKIELVSRFIDATKQIQDYGINNPDPNRENNTQFYLFGIKLFFTPNEYWTHSLVLSGVGESLFDKDPLNPGESGLPSKTRTQSRIFTCSYQTDLLLWDANTFSTGFEVQNAYGKNKTTGDPFYGDYLFDETIENFALYMQDQYIWNERLIVVAGLRLDQNDIADLEISPKISGAFFLFPNTKLRAGWSKGFRAPSVNELLYPDFGNSSLDTERTRSWEVGLEQTFINQRFGIDIAYFKMDFDQLIDFEVISTDPFIGRANNIAEAESSGLEVSSFLRCFDNIYLKGSYTYLEAENSITGERLNRRPKHQASVSAIIHFLDYGVYTMNATIVGERVDFDQILDAYVKLDASLSYTFHEHWTPYVRIENAIDQDYEEASGFPASGFLAFAGLKVEY